MAPGSLFPADTFIEYHSAFGNHTMTIPMNAVTNPGAAANLLEVNAWDASSRLWSDMVNDLVTEFLPRYDSDVEFDIATCRTYASVSAPPVPIGTINLALAGTVVTPGWAKATQETIMFRDTGSNIAKLVLLDFATGNDWAKYTNAAAIGVNGIVAQFTDDANGWRSRKDLRPANFIARTATLNEALRRNYRMA